MLLAASCPPPALAVSYEPSSSLSQDPAVRLEFEVWLNRFEMRYRALQATLAKARLVHDASAALVLGARASIDPFAEAAPEATAVGDLVVGIGLGCAVDELPRVVRFLEEAASSLAPAYQDANDLTLFVR